MNKQAFLEGYMSKEARLNAPAKPSIASKAGLEAKRKEYVKRNMSRSRIPEKLKPYRGEPEIAVPVKLPKKKKAIDKEAALGQILGGGAGALVGGAYGAAAGGLAGGAIGAGGNALLHAMTAEEKERELADYLKAALKGGAIGGGAGALAGGAGGAVLGGRVGGTLGGIGEKLGDIGESLGRLRE
jgi:hypothetical protein